MKYRQESHGTALVLLFEGEVRHEDLRSLTEALALHRRSEAKLICVDLGDCNYMSSAILGLLLDYHKQLRSEGRRLAVINPSRLIRKLLEITGLDQLISIHADLAEATRQGP